MLSSPSPFSHPVCAGQQPKTAPTGHSRIRRDPELQHLPTQKDSLLPHRQSAGQLRSPCRDPEQKLPRKVVLSKPTPSATCPALAPSPHSFCVVRTAVANLDRETQDRYEVVVQATDMAGQLGGLSGSTTVTIVITDVNDNPPRFPQKMYQFSMVETAPVGTLVGRVRAEDADVGENTDMAYQIKEEEEGALGPFRVATDSNTQEALVSLQQPLNFEAQAVHTVVLEALNKFADPRFMDLDTFRDQTIVLVSVLDADEPPEFRPPSGRLEVQEDALVGSLVGVVTAVDPDVASRPIRQCHWQTHLAIERGRPASPCLRRA
ncbi:cadherin-22 [Crotalus adamanteus]|uniref:Cadherin-22 n=1 Tax=Crotalus adamanteus TaxID=8729 RepID=A0AAW1BSH1_CROAD